MNIVDAIKSGRLHRRKSQREWCYPMSSTNKKDIIFINAYSIEDILADDWEVKEVQSVITKEDFEEAWKRATKKAGGIDMVYGHYLPFRDLVAKELGL